MIQKSRSFSGFFTPTPRRGGADSPGVSKKFRVLAGTFLYSGGLGSPGSVSVYTFSMCQISLAYSAMVRSEENLPLLQMFIQRFFAKVI